MPEKTDEDFIRSANKYKAKCIQFIIDNNITVAPKNMDPSIFAALQKLALERK
jgi:hypothetical protein